MIRKVGSFLAVVFLFSSFIFISGCGTTRGLAIGVSETTVGMAEDTRGFLGGIVVVDNWIKKNLW